ncbi:hypothetical protein LCGC14_2384790 [marine sediment metagenome]|uniref:Uncharacterized protein n=1 Tax=marine sediment metagenome TaxID=412755 RepID=A0A0F9EUI2_9ZZZZ
MTEADRKLINETIVKHGGSWWNESYLNYEGEEQCAFVGWIIKDLLEILEKDNLDLKVIHKK